MSFGIPVRNGLGVGLLASTFLSTLRIGGRPAMSLDFIGTNSLDSRVTFTRGTTATFTGSNGLIQTAAINAPRFDYDSATLAPKGLLIEEARTNTLLYSEQLDNVIWSKTATVTADQLVSPDGATTADLVSTTGNFQYVRQLIVATANAPYTVSFFVKPVSGSTTVRLYLTNAPQTEVAGSNFSLTGAGSLGTLFQTGTGVVTSRTITQLANGWYRCTVSGTVNTTTLYGYIDNHSNGTMSYGVWGAQLEAGAFATSYIPTTTLAVPRNADVAQMTGTNFSSWYNPTQGSFVAAFQTIQTGLYQTTGFVLGFDLASTKRLIYIATGADVASTFDGTLAFGAVGDVTGSAAKVVSAYNASERALSTNGGAVATGTVAAGYSTATSLNIGVGPGSTSQLNGYIRQLAYYNTRLPNATLQALTA